MLSETAMREAHGRLRTVCVTGTNGKTTTTGMLASIVTSAGEISARITTLGAWVGEEKVGTGPGWEPFCAAIEGALAKGVRTLALETTSKALAGGFAERWPPDVAVFTNLTRDHLDRHGSAEHYLASKARLFLALPAIGTAVLNACDPASALLDEVIPKHVRRVRYATHEAAEACAALPVELRAERVEAMRTGTRVSLAPSRLSRLLDGGVTLRVLGTVHADNALAAAVAADALGYDGQAIRLGLETFAGTPGRFEVVSDRPLVVVDYAHTPDALGGTLRAARSLVAAENGRVVCVFGCGGDRDAGKRPMMGRVADELADVVVLTSDNPRHEDPDAILDQVASGAREPSRWLRVPDRSVAIHRGISLATDRDVVVIAGKGHERTQQLGDSFVAFSDVDVARSVLLSAARTSTETTR